MQDHKDVVEQVKAHLESIGAVLTGPCGAFEITKRVAWALRAEGAGLLDKPNGNNCLGYAVDIICYRDGTIVDILVSAGDVNGPSWQVKEKEVDPARWRLALATDVPPIVVEPPTPPVVLPPVIPVDGVTHVQLLESEARIIARIDAVENDVKAGLRAYGPALARMLKIFGF